MSKIQVSRRAALAISAAASAGVVLPSSAEAGSSQAGEHPTPAVITTPSTLVVDTQHGEVRGYLRNGIVTFKGIPYGTDSGGINRWLPPKPPTPWNDVKFALSYGPCCPQGPHDYARTGAAFIYNGMTVNNSRIVNDPDGALRKILLG